MQIEHKLEFVIGTFIQELKNRFLCEVNISGKSTICYVPSSCHLSNFLNLKGKQVLLIPTKTPNTRTTFALFAVPYKSSYILLNSSMANRVIEDNIRNRRFAFLGKRNNIIKEHNIAGYKSDFFIADTNTILEIKSIISETNNAIFPTVYSERTLDQMKKFQELIQKGYKVCFCIVSLNPYVKAIEIDKHTKFFKELKKCLDLGMILIGYSCILSDGKLLINKQLPIK